MPDDLLRQLPDAWRDVIAPRLDPALVARLSEFVDAEYATHPVYPPRSELFAAFRLCPPDRTRVLLLGQDPYHKPGQAHGLSFSVPPGVAVPPSLRNIYKELRDDLGVTPPATGDLTDWGEQGVLLLNAVLTVRGGRPASHSGHGWEEFSDAVIGAVNDFDRPVVFVLFGSYARRKATLVRDPRHTVVQAGHPSPMNPKGFLGSRPFSAINAALAGAGTDPIAWS